MYKTGKYFVTVSLLALFLSACETTPQTVLLTPTIDVPQSNIGRGIPLIIDVRDTRKSRHFGTLGDSKATLSSQQPLDRIVKDALTLALDKQGFIKATAGNLNSLDVTIEKLGYESQSATLTDTITVEAVLSLVATHNGDTLKKTYKHTQEEEVVLRPDLETNQAWLNSVLNQALGQIANDQRLLAFLAGD